jgi:post-segregation antitoxin (ccd killing protein)
VSGTTRITVTLPSDQVAELKKITNNVSAYVAEAVARQLRLRLLAEELERYQQEAGAFTPGELAEARARIFGAVDSGGAAEDSVA